jgi:phage terminase large subunit-like protein
LPPAHRQADLAERAIATTYSADEPERLRGPQHDAAWCDEIASWRYPEAWDMLMFGLRLGDDPRAVVTTTPKPIKIIRG